MEENDNLFDLPETTQAVCHDIAALKRELEACFEQLYAVLESSHEEAITMVDETIGEVFDAVKNGRTVEDGFYEKQMARLVALIASREASLN